MARALDLFSYWSAVLGAIAFFITWIIGLANGILKKEDELWHSFSFKISLTTTALGILLAVISGQLIKAIARREVSDIIASREPKRVIIYSNGCASAQKTSFINVLNNLDVKWYSGRFRSKRYKMKIISGNTTARFNLIQNDVDSTLYSVLYPKYTTTGSNEIGVVRAEHIFLNKCK